MFMMIMMMMNYGNKSHTIDVAFKALLIPPNQIKVKWYKCGDRMSIRFSFSTT